MRASRMMALIGLFGVLTLSPFAHADWTLKSNHATEKNWHFSDTNSREAFLVLIGADSKWSLSLYEIADDGFQDKVLNLEFTSETEALYKAQSLRANYQAKAKNPHPIRPVAYAPLWKVTQQWNWDWERKFGAWIAAEIDIDLFQKYNVATDCADVPVYLRWIFARANGLPAANRLSGSNTMMSQDSVRSEWANLPTAKNWWEDKKFRAMSNYVTANTDTHSVVRDSYPIAINTDVFFEGAYHIVLHTVSGHARFIYRAYETEDEGVLPFLIMDSNLPRKVRILAHGPFWESEQPKVLNKEGGFIRQRWPVKSGSTWTLVDATKMPYYSLEQFTPEFMTHDSYALSTMIKLRPTLNFDRAFDEALKSLIEKFVERADVVEQGYKYCRDHSCASGSTNYDNWSTPSRDERIGFIIDQTEQIVKMAASYGYDTMTRWKAAQMQPALTVEGKTYTLGQLMLIWKKTLFSTDPRMSIARRWAVAPEAFSTNFLEQLKTNLSKRKSKIAEQGSSCKTSCGPGTDKFEKWETSETDAALANLGQASSLYCDLFSAADCDKVKAAIAKTTFTPESAALSMTLVLQDLYLLVSDPRAATTDRWFGRKKFFNITSFPFEVNINTNPGWAVGRKSDSQFLVNLATKTTLENSLATQWSVHPTLPLAVGVGKKQFIGVDLSSEDFAPLGQQTRSSTITWFENGSFAADDGDTNVLFQRTTSNWVQTNRWFKNRSWILSGLRMDLIDMWRQEIRHGGSNLITYWRANKLMLVDVEKGTEFALAGDFVDPAQVDAISISEKSALLKIYYYIGTELLSIHMIVNRENQTSKVWQLAPNQYVKVSATQEWLIVQTSGNGEMSEPLSATVHTVDSQWNISAPVLTGIGARFVGADQVVIQEAAQNRVFRLKGTLATPIIGPAGYRFQGQYGKYLLATRPSGESQEMCIFNLAYAPKKCAIFFGVDVLGEEIVLSSAFQIEEQENFGVYSSQVGFDYPLSQKMFWVSSSSHEFVLSGSGETHVLRPR